MPAAGGVLAIVSGSLGILTGLLVGTILAAIGSIVGAPHAGALAIPLLFFGLLAIVGGVFAIQKKVWGLALAGAISVLQLHVQQNPLEFFQQIAATYGDLASYRMAGELLFLVNDPALVTAQAIGAIGATVPASQAARYYRLSL